MSKAKTLAAITVAYDYEHEHYIVTKDEGKEIYVMNCQEEVTAKLMVWMSEAER